jgi:hypothetical protein
MTIVSHRYNKSRPLRLSDGKVSVPARALAAFRGTSKGSELWVAGTQAEIDDLVNRGAIELLEEEFAEDNDVPSFTGFEPESEEAKAAKAEQEAKIPEPAPRVEISEAPTFEGTAAELVEQVKADPSIAQALLDSETAQAKPRKSVVEAAKAALKG